MAFQLVPALLLTFASSAALGDDVSEENTKLLVEAVGVMNDAFAYYSSIDDPRFKCLTAVLPVYEPENHFAVYRYHFQGQNGESGTYINYCVNLTATETAEFGFSPCEDGVFDSTGQGYYFNGVNCFVGRFPLLGNVYCLLWVKRDFVDSFPEECVAQFDQNCGTERYALYDKEQCS
uniref:Putative lipocalin-5 1 n=1 Tax=Amblyomma triste TaxID=251400 RepID=A0A023GPI3_AMBTT